MKNGLTDLPDTRLVSTEGDGAFLTLPPFDSAPFYR